MTVASPPRQIPPAFDQPVSCVGAADCSHASISRSSTERRPDRGRFRRFTDRRYRNHLSDGDGSRVLRQTNFKTSNNPDVHIYMLAADDAKNNATVEQAGFIDLGSIKGNIGDQNYALGPDVDLAKHRAVSVWCKRFSVNFGAAPLKPDQTVSQQ